MPRPPNPDPRPYRVTISRYYTPDGQRCQATTPGAIRRVEQSRTFYADLPGAPRTPLHTDREAVAWKVLREKLKEAADTELGIRDEYTEHARTSFERHVAEWCEMLSAKGTTREQVDVARGRLLRLAALAGWTRLPQVDADSALAALAKVQEPPPAGMGKSAATRNHYLGHLKAFMGWCHRRGRLKSNPVFDLAAISIEADRRHARRCPSAEEIAELCRWLGTDAAPVRRKLTAQERLLGYQVSMATGFRAGELRALTPASFRLAEGTVTVPAAYSKRRRQDTQPLPSWIVEELAAWFATGGGWTWGRLNRNGPGKILKADLADCRAAWIDAAADRKERRRRETSDFLRNRVETPEGPRFWDYHSFRACYITELANQPGMDLKTLLALSRHSDPALSLQVYAKAKDENLRAAVDRLPAPVKSTKGKRQQQ